ncbi:hypothetical protein EW146_g649 [Bondarzewia mesenterica]|uniref:Uncharacterized protein n=1 Tax=Bondarzewia mesenterica TaxID=1095465 RepID=A0A4S4MCL2_9AGAM|nr:hypothetical protein EW146_g649 [Bondarzewia mesenterica]
MSEPDLPPTLLSVLQSFTSSERLSTSITPFSSRPIHPFSSSAEQTVSYLNDLIETTGHLVHSTNVHLNAPTFNSKTVSLLRQQTVAQHGLHLNSHYVRQTLAVLRERAPYGEDVPLEKGLIADWCIERISQWGAEVGMEAFPEADTSGRRTLVLGGKVLVLDVEFALQPFVDIVGVRTSYAVPNGAPGGTAKGSVSLDGFLTDVLSAWVREVQRLAQKQVNATAGIEAGTGVNGVDATTAALGKEVLKSFGYLMRLDQLASIEGDPGIRWFSDIDALGASLEGFAKVEAQAVASSLSLREAPLDIFLLRGHALPLPYLTSPSLSLLIHLSPRTYLSLLRNLSAPDLPSPSLPAISLPFSHLRRLLASRTPLTGATFATLSIRPLKTQLRPPAASGLPLLSNRPSFPLISAAAAFDYAFPIPQGVGPDEQCVWVLDFTASGRKRGVVMSQSRMGGIEAIVNPLSAINHMSGGGMITYISPTGAHPPLHLNLAAPEERGFLLEQVQVHNMTEVWAILEIVREQCWLNEILLGYEWSTEGLLTVSQENVNTEPPTENELQAILDGTFAPLKIPVNVYLPTTFGSTTDGLFDSGLPAPSRPLPRVVMTSPERPPISGLVQVTVTYDATRPRGGRG